MEIIGHNDEMEEKIGKENPSVADIANKRNLEIIEYLTAKGISESRLVPSSLGSSEANLEISESDEEELKLAKNRRVSFKVR